jgi:hypothetical protein
VFSRIVVDRTRVAATEKKEAFCNNRSGSGGNDTAGETQVALGNWLQVPVSATEIRGSPGNREVSGHR